MNEAIALSARERAVFSRQLRLSVLLPLGDARFDAVDNVASWTDRQTCDNLDFQIVAVVDGSDPDMEMAVSQILRPHDKVVVCPRTEHIVARLARGAKHADAEILLFAEHHCLPDPNCVEATIRFFHERPDAAAGVFTERQRPGSLHGDLDQRWFAEMEVLDLRIHNRMKLVTGAFAMRKDRYIALGCHDGRYGLFADEILTVKAKQIGMVVDRIADTAMTHITATMHDHQHHVEDYTRGECAFRAANDLAFCEQHFGHAHVWANRQVLDPGLARSTAAILSRVLARDLCSARDKRAFHGIASLTHELIRCLLLGKLGPFSFLAFGQLATRWSELRTTHLSRGHSNRWDHFQRSWQRSVHFARLSCALDHLERPSTIPMTPDIWSICDMPETQRAGFHGLEVWEGTPFRWSEPVMMTRIARPPGRVRVSVDTLPIRGGNPRYVRGVFWGDRRIVDIEIDDRSIHFPIDVASPLPKWLSIIANPLVDRRDPRRLGVPVCALSFASE